MRIRVLRQIVRTASMTSLLAICLASSPVAAQVPADPLNARVAGRLEQVSRMLDAASRTDANSLLDAKTEIEELPYPVRGDRRLARRLNATALEKFKAEQMAPALTDFERAWQADPSDQEITNNYGYALYRNNRLAEAESKLRYTLALAPARATAWANLAEVFGAQDQTRRAAEAFVVSHRFSRNPDITRQYIEKFASSSDVPGLKAGAGLALQKLFPAANANSEGSQALAVTHTERKAVDAIELAMQKSATPTEPLQATAAANRIPTAVAAPYARLLQNLPDPDVLALYQAAVKGSAEARETLLRMANAGNARGQNAVGNLYNHGQGVETNHELANTWYRKSAMAGFVLAQFSLAWNQHHGIGTPMDYALALDNYKRAAEQGHPSAMNNAGVMLERGTGTAMDLKAAFGWHMRAAETGLARGAYNVGRYLERGYTGSTDRKRALAYYLSAGNIGFPQAQLKVAQAYEYGWDGNPDKGMAIDWYKRAALQGLEPAKDALKRLGVADY